MPDCVPPPAPRRCPHRLLPLSYGTVVGDVLQCGYHGMCFDSEGHCTRVPAQSRIPTDAQVRSFPVMEHWGMVWIWMGDPALADPAQVFRKLPWGEPGWTLNTGPYTHVKADYRLLVENLLDFSRLEAFVAKLRTGYSLVMGNRFKGGILPGAMPPLYCGKARSDWNTVWFVGKLP